MKTKTTKTTKPAATLPVLDKLLGAAFTKPSAKATKANARAAKDIASAAAYAAKHGLDKPNGPQAPTTGKKIRGVDWAKQQEEKAKAAPTSANTTNSNRPIPSALPDAVGDARIVVLSGKGAKTAALKLATAPGTKTRKAAAEVDLRKQMLAEHKAKNGGGAKPAPRAKAARSAKAAPTANADGKCAKCGRVNSHGGDCRVAAACAARRKSGAQA